MVVAFRRRSFLLSGFCCGAVPSVGRAEAGLHSVPRSQEGRHLVGGHHGAGDADGEAPVDRGGLAGRLGLPRPGRWEPTLLAVASAADLAEGTARFGPGQWRVQLETNGRKVGASSNFQVQLLSV